MLELSGCIGADKATGFLKCCSVLPSSQKQEELPAGALLHGPSLSPVSVLLTLLVSRGRLSQSAQQTSAPFTSLCSARHEPRLMNQTTPVLLSRSSFHS